jgi:exodeoxyribonuclease V alpha subunit
MSALDNKDKEFLDGIVERVTFHNAENGFGVLRVKVKGHKDLITVIGSTPSVSPGEYIKCSGSWYNDRNHGLQFKADFLKSLPPNTLEGIEKYLGSGLIKGIGPHFAKKLVKAFGEQVFEVIEQQAHLLSTIEGIGKIRATTICDNWKGQKVVREIMIFLQSHGVTTTKATRIYKTYGDKAIEVVSENPYRLAKDIYGIGFISADKVAGNLGIKKDSLIRAQAGVNYVLLEATSDGNCGLPIDIMIQNTIKLIEIDESIVKAAIAKEIELGSLTKDNLNDVETIFLTSYYLYEKNIARMLLSLIKDKVSWDKIDTSIAIPWVEKNLISN